MEFMNIKMVILDAMGVIYVARDDVKELLRSSDERAVPYPIKISVGCIKTVAKADFHHRNSGVECKCRSQLNISMMNI
jgi:hypothetical protein